MAWPGLPAGRRSSGQCACAARGGRADRCRALASLPLVCVPCAECHSPAYILGHLCLSYCPPRYFSHTQQAVTAGPGRSATPALRVCSSCHPSCHSCRGGSPLNCTACPPSYTLDEHRGSCSGPVPPNGSPPAHRSGPPQLPPWPSPGRGPGLAGHGRREPLPLQCPLCRLPAAVWGPRQCWGSARVQLLAGT